MYKGKLKIEGVLKLLFKFLKKESIEVLQRKEEIPFDITDERILGLGLNLLKVKSRTLVINNCNPYLGENYKRVLVAEKCLYAGGCK